MYHNIVVVGRNIQNGKLFLDCFLSYSEEDYEQYKLYMDILKNPLWKVKRKEAKNISNSDGKKDLGETVYCMKMRSTMNNFSLCHFITEFKATREDFENLVECSNTDKNMLKKHNHKMSSFCMMVCSVFHTGLF